MDGTRIGKIIVVTVAVVSIVSDVFVFLFNLLFQFDFIDLITIIVRLLFVYALLRGANWARILFAIGSGLGAVVSFNWLFGSHGYELHTFSTVYYAIMLPFSIAACILLLFSGSVKEYMHEKRNQ